MEDILIQQVVFLKLKYHEYQIIVNQPISQVFPFSFLFMPVGERANKIIDLLALPESMNSPGIMNLKAIDSRENPW